MLRVSPPKPARFALLLLIACPPAGPAAGQGPLDFLQSESGSKYGLDPVAPGDLLGVVTDPDDQGVGGATVYLSTVNHWNKTAQKTVTDERGQFVFHSLEPGGYQLAAVKGNWASRTEYRKWFKVEHKMRLDAEPIVLPLKPARRLAVRVTTTGEEGEPRPLPGARVKATWQDLPDSKTTDEDGRVLFEGLAARPHTVKASGPGLAWQTQQIDLTTPAPRRVSFDLLPGAVLRGKILDEQGKPLAGVWISARLPGDPGGFSNGVRTNGAGEYRLPNTRAGVDLEIYASLNDYLSLRTKLPAITAGETHTNNWTLRRRPYGGAVEGVVLNAAGQPIVGATITNWGQNSNLKRTTTTDNEGRFLLDDLYSKRGGSQVIVEAPGHVGATRPVQPGTRNEPKSYRFKLKPGNRLNGRVVDEQGEPIANVRVQFGGSFFGLGDEKRTDSQGRFEFDTLPKGAKVNVSAKGFSSRRQLGLALNTDEPVDVVLPPVGKIIGVVVDDATGQPITDFHARGAFSPVHKQGDPSGSLNNSTYNGQQFTSAQGSFEFNSLTVGMPLMIVVEAEGYRTASLRRVVVPRASDAEPVEVRLQRIDEDAVTTVAGRVLDTAGEPVHGVRVCLLVTAAEQDRHGQRPAWYAINENRLEVGDHVLQGLFATTDTRGRFRFEGVYRDAFVEIAWWGATAAATRSAGLEKLSDDERTKLTLRAVKPATLRVTVDKDVPHFDSVQLSMQGGAWWSTPNNLQANQPESAAPPEGPATQPGKSEAWVIREIPPGEYRLHLYRYVPMPDNPQFTRSESVAQRRVTLVAGETKSLTITPSDRARSAPVNSFFEAIGRAVASPFSKPRKKKPAAPVEKSPPAKADTASP